MAQQTLVPIPVLIGRNVQRVREARGWSRTHLSHVAFMDRTTITIIESGYDGEKLNNPRVDTLTRLADALQVHVREFFRDLPTAGYLTELVAS